MMPRLFPALGAGPALCLFVCLLAWAFAGAACAATLPVPSGFKTIQEALDHASPGDTVHVAGGRYKGNIRLKAGVALQGEGSGSTFIEGDGTSSVVEGARGAAIEGFTITGSGRKSAVGAGIDAGISCNGAPMTIANNRITGNNAGISLYYSPSNVINNEISGSHTFAVYQSYSDSLISNNVIYGNTSYGVFNSHSSPEIVNNTIVGNLAGILSIASRGVIRNNIISENAGGGIVKRTEGPAADGAEPLLSHNLLWNNKGNDFKQSPGAVHRAPLFVDGAKNDYRLRDNSPALTGGEGGVEMGAFGGIYAQKQVPAPPKERSYASMRDRGYKLQEGVGAGITKAGRARARADFEANCAVCHGTGGRGDGQMAGTLDVRPRDLGDRRVMSSRTDDDIFKVIREGGRSAGFSDVMVSFGAALSDDAIRDIVRFIRTDICKCRYEGKGPEK